MQRMQGYAKDEGAVFVEKVSVEDVLLENGTLVGVRGTNHAGRFDARGKLVVDNFRPGRRGPHPTAGRFRRREQTGPT